MMRSSRWCAFAILALAFGVVGFRTDAAAQTSNATLQGIISDTSGAVLPGVTVKLESPATGLARDIVTNTAGVYVFNFLPAGTYVVSAELSGFKTARHDQVRLEIGQNLELDMRMEVGQLNEVVNVEGTAAPLDRTSPTIGTVIQVQPAERAAAGRTPLGGADVLSPPARSIRRRHAPQHAFRRPRARRQQLDL